METLVEPPARPRSRRRRGDPVGLQAETRRSRALDRAIRRGVEALRARQRPDGRWVCDPQMGPAGLSIGVICLKWLDALSPEEAAGAILALRRAQAPDGGFPIRPHAVETSLGATAVCRAALRAAGVPDGDPAVVAAERRITELGGYAGVVAGLRERGEPGAMFCAMVGLVPGDVLPPISPDAAALPWSERLLDGRVHAGVPVVFYAVAAVRERLCGESRLPAFLRGPTRLLARTRFAAFAGQFQNPDGSWNASLYNTVLRSSPSAAWGSAPPTSPCAAASRSSAPASAGGTARWTCPSSMATPGRPPSA